MFDREKIDELPKMQVDFINVICQPIFVHFHVIFNGDFAYRDHVLINKFNWLRLALESEQLKDWAGEQLEQFLRELKEMRSIDVNALQLEAAEEFDKYEKRRANC